MKDVHWMWPASLKFFLPSFHREIHHGADCPVKGGSGSQECSTITLNPLIHFYILMGFFWNGCSVLLSSALIGRAALQTFFFFLSSISAAKSEPAATPPPQTQVPQINPVSFYSPRTWKNSIHGQKKRYCSSLTIQPSEMFHCSGFRAVYFDSSCVCCPNSHFLFYFLTQMHWSGCFNVTETLWMHMMPYEHIINIYIVKVCLLSHNR